MKLVQSIVDRQAELTALRRDIHAHPEIGYEEVRTSALVAQKMQQWGIAVHRDLAKTGVVGVIRNGNSARSIGLRADMDALPMQEGNTFAHASQHRGRMHGCGHDGHTVMLLAAAQHLAQERNFDGAVHLIFQPAEEGGAGGQRMMEDGLFERFAIDAVFAVHNWPGMPVGKIAVSPGPVMASSSEFRITIHGKGAHAAMPYLGLDPVPVACQMVQTMQTIISRSRRPQEMAVLSVTMIHAGEATNVVPGSCELQGTVRTFDLKVLDEVEAQMRRVAEHTCAASGMRCEFGFHRNYPPTVNTAAEAAFARGVARDMLGSDGVLDQEPTMGAEDFAFMLQQKPGAYAFIGNGDGSHREAGHGAGPCMLHNPAYDFNDNLIPLGASYFVRLVEAWLRP